MRTLHNCRLDTQFITIHRHVLTVIRRLEMTLTVSSLNGRFQQYLVSLPNIPLSHPQRDRSAKVRQHRRASLEPVRKEEAQLLDSTKRGQSTHVHCPISSSEESRIVLRMQKRWCKFFLRLMALKPCSLLYHESPKACCIFKHSSVVHSSLCSNSRRLDMRIEAGVGYGGSWLIADACSPH